MGADKIRAFTFRCACLICNRLCLRISTTLARIYSLRSDSSASVPD
jgi:hypothetical protein